MLAQRSLTLLALTIGLAACSSADKPGNTAPPTPPPSASLEVDVAVSSVNLGGDCPDPVVAKPSSPAVITAESKSAAPSAKRPVAPANSVPAPGPTSGLAAERRAADCASPDGCGAMFCQQSSMQLELKATGTGTATKVEIVKVELLGADGQVIGELTPRLPTKWDDAASAYQAWDGMIAAAGDTKTSYSLSAPDWSKVPGGRYGGGKGLTVRVTLAVGDQRVTKTQTVTAVSVMVDPQVVT